MYTILTKILSDRKGGLTFTCFDAFHIAFIIAFIALAVFLCLYVKNKCKNKTKAIDAVINTAFGLYVLDFFVMPFSYGSINIEKLPFHVCTAMCVACFLSRYNSFFAKFKLQFAMLGFLSNLTYLIYPAGVMWWEIHPLTYRVLQTLLFHGVMMVYGALVLVCENSEFVWKKCYKDFFVILTMTAWAWLGNMFYNSELQMYNWFFVVRDPFNMFPESISAYIMPIINICLFFAAELIVYFIISKTSREVNEIK